MHSVLKGDSSPLKFWVHPKNNNFSQLPLFKSAENIQVPPKMGGGADTKLLQNT